MVAELDGVTAAVSEAVAVRVRVDVSELVPVDDPVCDSVGVCDTVLVCEGVHVIDLVALREAVMAGVDVGVFDGVCDCELVRVAEDEAVAAGEPVRE